mmetsp:Transcript_4740/g.18955  ORF Transcript_4740/g.18955 Transcript_4740/m.18955 type:complete len:204 (-) Transcript_4740:1553-2164(-)
MSSPLLLRDLLVWAPFGLHLLRVRLLMVSIQVLVESIKQEAHELLTILLRIPSEGGVEGAHCSLEGRRSHDGVISAPHVLEEVCVHRGQLALHPQWVALVDVVSPASVEEKPRQLRRVGDALQHGVHEAGVPQILQAHGSCDGGLPANATVAIVESVRVARVAGVGILRRRCLLRLALEVRAKLADALSLGGHPPQVRVALLH